MSIMESAIGILAPAECIACGAEGRALCAGCAKSLITPFGERCWRCNKLSPNSRTCESCRHTGSPTRVWIVTDHDGITRDLISLYKFGHNRSAAGVIAGLMAGTFLKYSTSQELENYLVVPVPTATHRMRERGFGHAELLAKKVAINLRLEYSPALRRLGQSRQLGATREARLKQLTASFAAKSHKAISGRKILLIDDVVTTGGTIIAAAQTLRAAGAKQVDALLFAKRL